MRKLTYIGTVGEDGKLKLSKPRKAAMESDIAKMKAGRQIEIILNPLSRRSNSQNAYMWSVVYPTIQERLQDLGNECDTEQVHEIMKAKFNSKKVFDEDGVVYAEIPQSTTTLSKEDFGIYIDKIIAWAAEFLQIEIPLPNSQQQFNF